MWKKNRFITGFLVLLFAITISQSPANSQQLKPEITPIREVHLVKVRGTTYEVTEVKHHHWTDRNILQKGLGIQGKKVLTLQTVSGYPVDVDAKEIDKKELKEIPDWRTQGEKHPRITLTVKTGWLIGSNLIGNLVK